MAVLIRESEVATAIPPATMFKIFALEAGTFLPKILPQFFKAIDTLEGNGEAGTIRKTIFPDGSGFKYVTNRVDSIDLDNITYSYTTIAGDPWLDTLDKASYDVKLVTSGDGGSICKAVAKYYRKSDAKVNADQIKAAEEKVIGLFKPLEAAILANPDAY